MNRLAGLAGVGQTSTAQTGQLGANMAANVGQTMQQGAQAQASGYLGSANAWGQGIAGVGQAIGTGLGYYASRPQTPQTTGSPAYVSQNVGPMGGYTPAGLSGFGG